MSTVSIRVSAEALAVLKELAQSEDRSIRAEVDRLIKKIKSSSRKTILR